MNSNDENDVDKACKIVIQWEQDLLNQSRECETLNQEIKSLKWKLELIETSYSECRNQRDELYKTIENLQDSIKEHLNKSDKVQELMEENKSLKDQVNNIKTKNELDISEEKNNCENLKKHYEKILEDIKISNSQELVKVKEDFSNKEKMLKSTIESFKKELSEKTLNNESEMIKVHVEFERKISILNGQLTSMKAMKSTNDGKSKNSAAVCSLERKLKHQEERYTQQIRELQNELSNLKRSFRQEKSFKDPAYTKPSPSLSFIKRRKF